MFLVGMILMSNLDNKRKRYLPWATDRISKSANNEPRVFDFGVSWNPVLGFGVFESAHEKH